MNWLENTREDFGETETSRIVILPFGSCEQHYSHLPVGTDTFIGEHILENVQKVLRDKVVILPYVWFGFSQHHMEYAGSLTVGNSTLTQLTIDLCDSIYKNNFRKIVLFNSHGGNTPALQVAVNEIGIRKGLSPVLMSYWSFLKDDISAFRESPVGGIGHAGELETSLGLYLFSEYVKDLPAESSYNYNPYQTYDMFSGRSYYTFKMFSDMVQGGLVGDPSFASAKKGEKMFSSLINKLCDFFQYYYENEL